MIKLDHSKLLGFRNLIPVMAARDDLLQASEQAFNKKGEVSTTSSMITSSITPAV